MKRLVFYVVFKVANCAFSFQYSSNSFLPDLFNSDCCMKIDVLLNYDVQNGTFLVTSSNSLPKYHLLPIALPLIFFYDSVFDSVVFIEIELVSKGGGQL